MPPRRADASGAARCFFFIGLGTYRCRGLDENSSFATGGDYHPQITMALPEEKKQMIGVGIVLMLIGFILAIPVLWSVGIVVLFVGLVLLLLGSIGHAVGGRRHYY